MKPICYYSQFWLAVANGLDVDLRQAKEELKRQTPRRIRFKPRPERRTKGSS